MNIFSIYKITHLESGRTYIGFTCRPERRWAEHIRAAHRGSESVIHRAIRKHGPDAFTFAVIYQSPDGTHTHNVMEPHFITEYNSYVAGFNMTMGGDGGDCISGLLPERYQAYVGKISGSSLRLWQEDDYRQKSTTSRREYGQTAEFKDKMRDVTKRQLENPEYRQKRKDGLKRYWATEEGRQRIAMRKHPRAKTYTLKSPTGEIHTVVGALKKFCADHGLSYALIKKHIGNGGHLGWTIIEA